MASDFEMMNKLKKKMVSGCKKCAGTGLIGDAYCDCMAQFSKYVNYHYRGIEKEYWDLTMDDFHGDQLIKNKIKDYIDNIANAREHGLGLVLSGPHGTGKSLCGVLILKAALEKGYSISFITLAELMKLIKYTFDKESDEYLNVKDKFQEVCESDFLVIDDLGDEYTPKDYGTFCVSELSLLVRNRRRNCQSIIVTTNLSQNDMLSKYGSTISSLLKSNTAFLTINGADYRLKQGEKWSSLLKGDVDV